MPCRLVDKSTVAYSRSTVAIGSGRWIVKRDRLRLADAADAQDQSGISTRVSPPWLLRTQAIKYQYTSANIYAHAGGQSYGRRTIKNPTKTFSFSLLLVSLPLLLVFEILIYLFNDLEESVPAVSCNTIKFLYHDSLNLCSSSFPRVVFIEYNLSVECGVHHVDIFILMVISIDYFR